MLAPHPLPPPQRVGRGVFARYARTPPPTPSPASGEGGVRSLCSLWMVRCGIAGWIDRELIGSKKFYPQGVSSSEERLQYYASQFSMVEVDSSYYGMPS